MVGSGVVVVVGCSVVVGSAVVVGASVVVDFGQVLSGKDYYAITSGGLPLNACGFGSHSTFKNNVAKNLVYV